MQARRASERNPRDIAKGATRIPLLALRAWMKGEPVWRGAGMEGSRYGGEPGSAKVEETRRMSDLLCVPFRPG